ncbi:MAG TPA: methyltransferase domain-containing protein [Opitutaceae bacterium]|nr:methyltransferase domain-containing protein [Opitutaceae bacterium]HRJ45749.1 methyltransferase domain-containing protein [Opitutaceae bacterium]
MALVHFSLRRSLFSYAKVQAVVGHLIRNRPFQLRRQHIRQLGYLDLGCGLNTHAGFINLDYQWRPDIDVCWDVTRGLPFADSSMDGVFSEHCLEHFSLPDAERLLKEVRRIIRADGTFRIIVPDAERYLRTYIHQVGGHTEQRFPFQDTEAGSPTWTPLQSVNRVFYQDRESPAGHRIMYDAQLMEKLLRLSGFTHVTCCDFAQGRDPTLLIDTADRAIESLYMEASP